MESDILIIKALVAAKKGGMPLRSLGREYRDMVGDGINYTKYGFRSLEDMVKSSPELRISLTSDGPVISVHDHKMSHVTSLVNRQKSAKPRKRKGFSSNFGQRSRCNFNKPSSSYVNGKYPTSSHSNSSYQQPRYSTGQPHYSTSQPRYSTGQPHYSTSQPRYSTGQPHYSTSQPRYSTVQPRYSTSQPSHSLYRPSPPQFRPADPPQRDYGSARNSEPVYSKQNSVDSWSDNSSDSDTAELRKPQLKSVIVKIDPKVNRPAVPEPIRSGTKYMVKSIIPSYQRTACSFGAGDVRFSGKKEAPSLSSGKVNSDPLVSSLQNLKISDAPTNRLHSVKDSTEVLMCNSSKTDSVKEDVTKASEDSAVRIENSCSNRATDCVQNKPTSIKLFGFDSDDESPPLMGIGRGRLRQKPEKLEKVPGGCATFNLYDSKENSSKNNSLQISKFSNEQPAGSSSVDNSDEVIVVDAKDGSSRVATFSTAGGLSVTLINSTVDNSSSCLNDGYDDWDEFEPTICNYQLIGDDVALRIAEVALDCQIKKSGSTRSCGLCIEGLTIEECCKFIEMEKAISDQVLVVLGLTDILSGSTFQDMKVHTETLLALLKKRNTLPVVLTIPTLPCLLKYPKCLATLTAFNKWLLQLQRGLRYFWVMDITQCLLGPDDMLFLPYFEKMHGQRMERFSVAGAKALFETICGNMV